MTKEEAIKILEEEAEFLYGGDEPYNKIAFDMAIEALQEPKTIIGIDVPYGSDKGIATIFKGNEKMALEEVKEIMSVVRCKDCQYRKKVGTSYYCELDEFNVKDEDFCSWGKRKGGDEE